MYQKGFTLLEIVIVVAIIGILTAIAMPQYQAYRIRAYNANTTTMVKLANAAEIELYAEIGAYGNIDPAGNTTLSALPAVPAGPSGPADSTLTPALRNNATAATRGGLIAGTNISTGASFAVPLAMGVNMTLETSVPAPGPVGVNSSIAFALQARHRNGDKIYGSDSNRPNILFVKTNNNWPGQPGLGGGAVTLPAKPKNQIIFDNTYTQLHY